MRKVHIVSSLLVAFGLSVFNVGCDPAKKPATNSVKKLTGPGSTTGGGTVVPAAPAGGTTETPNAKPEEKAAEDKKPEDTPADAKPEEKAEDKKPEEKKADEAPAADKKAEDK